MRVPPITSGLSKSSNKTIIMGNHARRNSRKGLTAATFNQLDVVVPPAIQKTRGVGWFLWNKLCILCVNRQA